MPINYNFPHYIIPDNRRRPLNLTREQKLAEIEQVRKAFTVGLMKANNFDGEVIANDLDWDINYNMPAAMVNDGRVKTWTFPQAFEAVHIGRDGFGAWAQVANTHDSLDSFQWVPRDVSDFYKKFRKLIPYVPNFITQNYSLAESERMQFGDGPAVDFPLGKIWRNDPLVNFKVGMPQGIAYLIRDDTGQAIWFRHADFAAVNPLGADGGPAQPPQPPSSNLPPLSDSLIVSGVKAIVDGQDADAEKVRKFKQIVSRAR